MPADAQGPACGRRGRLAPTPSGLLHVGHARTFAAAAGRAAGAGLVLRIEDLDLPRCREAFVAAALDDLRWLGLRWTEGPDRGGPVGPYRQSLRADRYRAVWRALAAGGFLYPSPHSRRDLEEAGAAPHEPDADGPHDQATPGEPIFPVALRPEPGGIDPDRGPGDLPWRFRVPDGRRITFHDAVAGVVSRTAGIDFGDFVVWRREGLAAYELAVVTDDHQMGIEEVVRGDDLLTSTARQILLYEALGWQPPAWCHRPLVRDAEGRRLAKRSGGLAIGELRARGRSPRDVLEADLADLAG